MRKEHVFDLFLLPFHLTNLVCSFLGTHLSSWPWKAIKLIAFSAPIVVDSDGASVLNAAVRDKNKVLYFFCCRFLICFFFLQVLV